MLQYNPSISGSLSVTGSLIVTNGMIGTVSGVDVQIFSSSINQVITGIQAATGSQEGRLGSIESFTSSTSARLGSIETISASNFNRIGSLETISASNVARISALEITSASVDVLNTTQNTRLNSLEAKTGSLATTGSNTFYGTQTITGSLYISSDLIVQGSSSLQNITASAVSIGTNLINLNTANPAVRYAGLVIGDSGSIVGSGSFLYDSLQDEMIFIHRGANTTVTSSVTLMGPQTFDNIGNETYPTTNRIQKGTGNEHLTDSNISDNGTTIILNSNTEVTGSLNITSNSIIGNAFTIQGGTGVTKHYFTSAGSGDALNQLYDNTGDVKIQLYTNGNSYFNGGRVGIGTTSPLASIHIAGQSNTNGLTIGASNAYEIFITGSDSANIYHASPNQDIYLNTNGGKLYFGTSAASTLLTISGGNVGIGSETPSFKLDVSGTTRIANTLRIDGFDSSGAQRAIGFGGNTLNTNPVIYSNGSYLVVNSANSNTLFLNPDSNGNVLIANGGGNVGIGITNPSYKLDVVGDIHSTSELYLDNGYYLRFKRSSGGLSIQTLGIPTGTDDVRLLTTGDFNLVNGSLTNLMTVKNGGNVGIGTNSPTQALHVYRGGASNYLRIQGDNNSGYDIAQEFTDGTNAVYSGMMRGSTAITGGYTIWAGGAARLNVLSSGRVGIGITNPSASLHVTAPFSLNSEAFRMGWSGVGGMVGTLTSTSGQPYVTYGFYNGNVVMGTSTAVGRLHTAGAICISNAAETFRRALLNFGQTGTFSQVKVFFNKSNWGSVTYDIKLASAGGSYHTAGAYYSNPGFSSHVNSINAGNGPTMTLVADSQTGSTQGAVWTFSGATMIHPMVTIDIACGNGYQIDPNDVVVQFS